MNEQFLAGLVKQQALEDTEQEMINNGELTSPPSVTAVKPVMSAQVESDVLDALSQYINKDKWKEWGMHLLRDQGSAILLAGPPGVGKTSIAKWMSKKLKKGFKHLQLSNLSSDGSPGSMEKSVTDFFTDCRRRHNCFIFMDECDQLLISRDQISGDGKTWQLGTTETIMTEMNVYPGPIVCATNHEQSLDAALADRFMYIVQVGQPDMEMRKRLWKMKLPKAFPLSVTEGGLATIAKYQLNGRQIETVIVNVASHCIRKSIKPTLVHFTNFCQREEIKHIK